MCIRDRLKRIPELLKRRSKNFSILRQGLKSRADLGLLNTPGPERISSHYCAVVLLKEGLRKKRNELVQKLNQRGIGTSIYYPHPVPRFRYYAEKYGYTPGAYPGAEAVADESVSLPVGPHLDENQIMVIVENLQQAADELK